LFERKADPHAETFGAAGAFERGTHDAGPRTGADHETRGGQPAAELGGHEVGRMVGRGSRGSKGGDFSDAGVGTEDCQSCTDLGESGGSDQLEVGYFATIGHQTDEVSSSATARGSVWPRCGRRRGSSEGCGVERAGRSVRSTWILVPSRRSGCNAAARALASRRAARADVPHR